MDERVVITLFRHGVTDDNKRGAYIGWTNPSISEGAEFADVPDDYDLIFTSDLDRCLQTTKRLFPHRKPITMPLFREILFGEWEGKTYADLEHDRQYQRWVTDPLAEAPPGGESFTEFTERIDQGFQALVEQLDVQLNKKVILTTHGGVIRYLLMKYAPEKKSFWEWKVPHGSAVELEWKREDLRRDARCTSLRVVPIMANQNG
ncbi:histidine phosphatase family protein [Bacillus sp. RAR_GA_16]|uniref:histidine phosphatase family protein n=1 Tax=Bacillus sp. RAR_GA_16 TaxID=2876774 RepID=UPI001CC931ED|nr:histidine phosphatase family protein [Bacillus sp. RAR_GA_16]MCA0170399.1 histidine phosphatase family protein [Bacillus sp. RAR_GA_16]